MSFECRMIQQGSTRAKFGRDFQTSRHLFLPSRYNRRKEAQWYPLHNRYSTAWTTKECKNKMSNLHGPPLPMQAEHPLESSFHESSERRNLFPVCRDASMGQSFIAVVNRHRQELEQLTGERRKGLLHNAAHRVAFPGTRFAALQETG
ncbi:uncharacterized protein RCC_06059 [Ramularia collo-cygni]|uniref:Uncharacterized protein n=1 Tax=Ramularia collo-cygni TaxID=112498 RepID=A0A2D3USB6_9PEZI|nr:uncharacterized protein RCC_06059 [Ramularia collo-cygni]CZT20202.1 uncharacterized protein RCC_06059 [Ramularia collo-cygni]